jgi:hypothetical protein
MPFTCNLLILCSLVFSIGAEAATSPLKSDFHWESSAPGISPEPGRADRCISVKDPSIVQFGGKWHMFVTIRSEKRTHQIEYLNFGDWAHANEAPRHILTINNGYFCAPQVFYYTPHKKWYMIHQISLPRKVQLQPAFSTTTNIFDPASWSASAPLYSEHPANITAWIDFWVICDSTAAHLFFTSNNGKLWRADTTFAQFPHGWTEPRVVLEADIFEASHTYALKGAPGYLTIVEAVGPHPQGRRYYKAYQAESLAGSWSPLADSFQHAFASPENVRFTGEHWSDSFSHGELLRTGFDEKLEVDPKNLAFLFQGVLDRDRHGKQYGDIPWRLGLLKREQ